LSWIINFYCSLVVCFFKHNYVKKDLLFFMGKLGKNCGNFCICENNTFGMLIHLKDFRIFDGILKRNLSNFYGFWQKHINFNGNWWNFVILENCTLCPKEITKSEHDFLHSLNPLKKCTWFFPLSNSLKFFFETRFLSRT
jgi:hypothetical protein